MPLGGLTLLGDAAPPSESFDPIDEIAPDGTWTHTATQREAA